MVFRTWENDYALPRRSTTGEQVAELLRDQILSGQLGRGAPLREEAIARDFEVSRRTARDALRVLENDGLARHQRHRGSTVTDFDSDDIIDMYRSRQLLEAGAAQWWCEQEDTDDARFSALEESYRLLEQTIRRGDPRRIVEADLGFHTKIIGLLGSPRVDRFMASITTQMVYALAILETSLGDSRTQPEATLAEHRAILEALQSKSHPGAADLINAHVQFNSERLVSIVRASS